MEKETYIEKGFIDEIIYYLNSLYYGNSTDELGTKAEEILNDDEKIRDLKDKLIEDDEIWETIHNTIEYYMFH